MMMEDLSKRELDILQLLWDGMENKQIALTLGLSPCYVKNLQDRMRLKLHASSRVQLVRKGLEKGLLHL